MKGFDIVALTPPGAADPSLAIAASRAEEWGFLDLTFTQPQAARQALNKLTRFGRQRLGVRLDCRDATFIADIAADLSPAIATILLTGPASAALVQAFHRSDRQVWLEVNDLAQAEQALAWGADALVAKGQEAGGWAGEATTFILLQQVTRAIPLPVYAHGGIGRHTVAAAYIAGAAGVVLDWQLALVNESGLPDAVKERLRRLNGSETAQIGHDPGLLCRLYLGNDAGAAAELRQLGYTLDSSQADAWREAVAARVGWGALSEDVWLVGQDVAFAADFADRFHNVRGVCQGLRANLQEHVRLAADQKPLGEGSPLARSHGTRFPIVQGPRIRITDVVPFTNRVMDEGALPFISLGLMRTPEAEELLKQTQTLLGNTAWGVNLPGFIPATLRDDQVEVVRRFKPLYAMLSADQFEHARLLEGEGIHTYLLVQEPGQLPALLQQGARRFALDGRESGSSLGPRTSLVLWEQAISILLDNLPKDAANVHVLFSGGVHDALSAAMVSALGAPLVARDVKIGVMMTTAYVFTREAVETGAVMPRFQQAAMEATETITLESGAGRAIRALPTPFAGEFVQLRRRLFREGMPAGEVQPKMEFVKLGRFRIASKGLGRHPNYGREPGAPKLISLSSEEQYENGLYLLGQVAGLRREAVTIAGLHTDVVLQSAALLDRFTLEPEIELPAYANQPSQIAIVGIETLLPKAGDKRQYWENILNAVYALSEIPRYRWDYELFYDPDPSAKDKIYSKWGGFLDDVPFDPLEFGMPPNSLRSIDPMQLLALKVAKAALADAGYLERGFDRSRTSVILGASGGTGDLGGHYLLRSSLPLLFGERSADLVNAAGNMLPEWTEDSFAGLLLNVAAGRIANRLDLGGVNYIVDAACASSLTAVHLACKELETHNTDIVIVGGVDTVQNPFGYLCFSKTHALSPNGVPRTFDAESDGITISEGIAMLVLKRLADAERDGDRIYAVIQGVSGSSDGKAKGMTAPRPEGQMLALQRAYAKAGIDPATVELFEAHGTGTAVGDRTEAISLGAFLEQHGAQPGRHAVGSVKSMIGHTKASAGVAALAKAALSIYHKVLPPTLGVRTPNPASNFNTGPLYVNSETRPWIGNNHPRRAGVSAFGFGGTNFHVVVEEYQGDYLSRPVATADNWPNELFLWSGNQAQDIQTQLKALLTALQDGAQPNLRDLAYTLSRAYRPQAAARLAIVASALDDLRGKIDIALNNLNQGNINHPRGVYYGERGQAGKVALLFPGQGSQYPNMLRDLAIHFPEVRAAFELADHVLDGHYDQPLSRLVFPPPAFDDATRAQQQAAITATDVAQPALGAASMGLYRLLQSLGLSSDMAAGHSYGEYAALWAAGVIDDAALPHISQARGRCMIEAAPDGLGTMAAAAASEAAVSAVIANLPEVWVANLNAPTRTIISGSDSGIAQATAALQKAGIQTQPIQVAAAFHSPIVAPAQTQFSRVLAAANFATPTFPVYSNTSAGAHSTEPQRIREQLDSHLSSAVRFVAEIEQMYTDGARIFIEVGPRNVLTNLTGQILDGKSHLAVAVDHPKKDGLTTLLQALGQLAAAGVKLNLARLFEGRAVRRLNLADLARDTQPTALPATTWYVNGGHARPYKQPKPIHEPLSRDELIKLLGLSQMNGHGPASAVTQPAATAALPAMATPSRPASLPAQPVNANPTPAAAPAIRPNPQPATPPQPGLAVTRPAPVTPSTPSNLVAPMSNPSAPVPFAPPAAPQQPESDTAAVMLQFQNLMSRFLDTQRSVMLSYLQGGGAPVASPSPATPTTAYRPPAMPAPTAPAATQAPAPPMIQGAFPAAPATPPLAMPGMPAFQMPTLAASAPPVTPAQPSLRIAAEPAAAIISKEVLTTTLREIVAERTGYPAEMLDLEVDIEAELGIDSIKRVEILGAFQKQALRADQEIDQEAMDRLTAIKTLGGIVDWIYQAISEGAPPPPPTPAPTITIPSRSELSTALRQIVAERTGYPAEMLDLNVDIEAELGIDSIKRVEILGVFQKQVLPAEQEIAQEAMDELTAIKTLGGIVNWIHQALEEAAETMGATAAAMPAPAPVVVAAIPSKDRLSSVLRQIVAERTGYPADMLDLNVDIEAELGIDSIKRVEILGVFQKEVLPAEQEIEPGAMDELTTIKTLGGIIDWIHQAISAAAPGGAAPAAPSPAPVAQAAPAPGVAVSRERLSAVLRQIVADRTGYPADVLDLSVDIEAELGIDSIKRVEILGAFQKEILPGDQTIPQEAMDELTTIKTLGGIIDWIYASLVGAPASAEPVAPPAPRPAPDVIAPPAPAVSVPRSFLVPVDAPPPPAGVLQLSGKHVYLVTDDGHGIAADIAERITQAGGRAVLVQFGERLAQTGQNIYQTNLMHPDMVTQLVAQIREEYGPIGGLVHLLPLAGMPPFEELDLPAWQAYLRRDIKTLFFLARAAAAELLTAPHAFVVAATASAANPSHAGVTGFLKTAAKEWEQVRVQAIDLDVNNSAEVLAEQVWQELQTSAPEVVVQYRGVQRQLFRQLIQPVNRTEPQLALDRESVVLVTGGARGITAKVALRLARVYGSTLILVGRSSLPAEHEDAATAGLTDPKAIKGILINQLKAAGQPIALKEVEQSYNRLLNEREMRQNLADLDATGVTWRYFSANVRDEAGMREVVQAVYGEFGRIDGVIHGAGIIEDKLIVDKTPESFDRVFDTKADSLFILTRLLDATSLRFLALFSSAAGALGNRGQSDYAATNDIMNKVARHLDQQWSARVAALCWGPWAKEGMVTPELRRQFEAQGIHLIEIEDGCRALDDEIRYGHKGQSEIIYAGGAWGADEAEPHLPSPVVAAVNGHSNPNGHQPGQPLLAGAAMNHHGDAFEVIRTLDVAHDRYLDHHRLDGKPVLPAAVAMEFMLETAQAGWPAWHAAAIRDVQVLKGVKFDKGQTRQIRIIAKPQSNAASNGEGFSLELTIADPDKPRVLNYRAIVDMRRQLPAAPTYQLPSLTQTFPLSVAEAYNQWLFHGPIFQAITTIAGMSETDFVAEARPSNPQLALSDGIGGDWLLDPVVVDAALQMSILWSRAQLDMTTLIARVKQFQRFGSLSAQPVNCHLDITNDVGSRTLTIDIAFVDAAGKLIARAEGVEFPYTEALNRLAGKEVYAF